MDRVVFVDCDLRRANLSVTDGCILLAPVDVEFIGCDLREANWHGRDLSRVKMTDCRLHGASRQDLADQRQSTGPGEPPAEHDQVLAHSTPNRRVWS
jgi:uncharacterized protein YjbI with pentapeptide repeats